MRRIVRYVVPFITWLFLLPTSILGGDLGWPRVADYYTRAAVEDRDVGPFSDLDLLILPRRVDNRDLSRSNLDRIKEKNPEIILLLYCESTSALTNLTPPDPIKVAADEYDWWLKSYDGNNLYYVGWEYEQLLNMTNSDAAEGSHPEGQRPNQFVPELLVNDHLLRYDHWDGIFYDTFASNLSWMHPDIKDGTRDGIAEYDNQNNGNQPRFSTMWDGGMVTLASETRARSQTAIIVGNGGNRSALAYINGKIKENYSHSKNLSQLTNVYRYLSEAVSDPKIGIVNGVNLEADPTDYPTVRWSLGSSLLIGAYLAFDFGAQNHGEYLLYDEFCVKRDGEINARTTELASGVDEMQTRIEVTRTTGFTDSGLIWIDGELIHYSGRDSSAFLGCFRGYPVVNKYDLRMPHAAGARVIQYGRDGRGYLGEPLGGAYDVEAPDVLLGDLLHNAGWIADPEAADDIDSRIWRRDFEYGTVIVNPRSTPATVTGLGTGVFRKLNGLQDPPHNDGSVVLDSLVVGSRDSYILMRIQEASQDTTPPLAPGNVTIIQE